MTTNTVKHTPDDAAPIEIAGMFLEWQRIEDAKAELAEQSKDLFKVAKDKGYDTKAMRAVFRDKRVEIEASPEDVAKAEEAEAMNDLYRSALDRGLTARARPAHSAREIIEEFPPHDPETGDLADEEQREHVPSQHELDTAPAPVQAVEGKQECDTLGVTAGETATNSNSSEPLRSDKAETLPSSPEVSAANPDLRPVSQAAGSPASDAAPREAGATTAAASRSSSMTAREIDATIPALLDGRHKLKGEHRA